MEGAAVASAFSLVLWKILAMIYAKRKFGFFIGYLPFYTFLNEIFNAQDKT